MDGVALLTEAYAAGFQVRAEDERLIVRGPKRLAALAQQLLSHKEEILKVLELVEERTAIMEYDGGLSRAEAERLAWGCLRDEAPTIPMEASYKERPS
jgi:hypothetical protein